MTTSAARERAALDYLPFVDDAALTGAPPSFSSSASASTTSLDARLRAARALVDAELAQMAREQSTTAAAVDDDDPRMPPPPPPPFASSSSSSSLLAGEYERLAANGKAATIDLERLQCAPPSSLSDAERRVLLDLYSADDDAKHSSAAVAAAGSASSTATAKKRRRSDAATTTTTTTTSSTTAAAAAAADSPALWRAAADNAAAQLEHMRVRQSNLELLKLYGKPAWLDTNAAAAADAALLDEAARRVDNERRRVNASREAAVADSAPLLRSLEQQYADAVRRNAATRRALTELEQRVDAVRRAADASDDAERRGRDEQRARDAATP